MIILIRSRLPGTGVLLLAAPSRGASVAGYMTDSSPDEITLHRLLSSAFDDYGAQPRRDEVQVLDLACGECREVEAVSATALEKLGREGAALRFTGADIRGAEIDTARRRARRLTEAGATVEFMQTDCAKLEDHRELGRSYDMVFLRHQNYWHDRPAWRRIFSNGLARLNDSGLFVITSYFDVEHDLAVKAITAAGGELIASVRNGDSRALPTEGKSVDRHLAVFRRKR
jgi:chemotaxis methyl-accepting protein methylase